jgi:hypothetical protein
VGYDEVLIIDVHVLFSLVGDCLVLFIRRFQAYLTKEGIEWIVAPYEADAQVIICFLFTSYVCRLFFFDILWLLCGPIVGCVYDHG